MLINIFKDWLVKIRYLSLKNWLGICAIVLCCSVSVSAVVLASKRLSNRNEKASLLPTGKVVSLRVPSQSAKPLTGISVNLTRFGFEPSEITIPAGGYLISVRNLTERADISFALENSVKLKLLEEQYKNGSRGWDKILNLLPDSYVLREGKNQNWQLSIKVKSQK